MKENNTPRFVLLGSGLVFVFLNVFINIWIAGIVCLTILVSYFERDWIRRKLKLE